MVSALIRRVLSVGAIILLPVMPVTAATISYSDTLPGAATRNQLATGTSDVNAILMENTTGTIVNDRRSPWDAPNSAIAFNDPAAFYSAVRRGTAYFDLGVVRGGVSFVWGTPGPLNVFELFLNGVSQLRITGSNAVGPNGSTFSRLTTISNLRFDRMEFSAGNPAFEFANLSVAAVPLPAGGLLLLAAIGGLALLRRRQSV